MKLFSKAVVLLAHPLKTLHSVFCLELISQLENNLKIQVI